MKWADYTLYFLLEIVVLTIADGGKMMQEKIIVEKTNDSASLEEKIISILVYHHAADSESLLTQSDESEHHLSTILANENSDKKRACQCNENGRCEIPNESMFHDGDENTECDYVGDMSGEEKSNFAWTDEEADHKNNQVEETHIVEEHTSDTGDTHYVIHELSSESEDGRADGANLDPR